MIREILIGILSVWLLCFIGNNCYATKEYINSKEFQSQPDTAKLRILVEISDTCEISEIKFYTVKAIKIGSKIPDLPYDYMQLYAAALNNEAFYYDQIGNIKASVTFYLKSLGIREKLQDTLGMAESYNNLGYMFQHQGDLTSSSEYYSKAKRIFELMNDRKGLVNVYINVGNNLYLLENLDSAQYYFKKGLELAEEINDMKGISYALNNLGAIYDRKGMTKETEEIYIKSLAIREQLGGSDAIARSHHNLGRFYYKQDKMEQSYQHSIKSFEMGKQLNSPDILGDAAILLSDIYLKQKDFEKAYRYLMIHVEMKDSILSNETQQSTVKQQAKYEYEKQKAIDDKEHEKQLAISAEQEKKQKVIIYAIAGGLGLVLLFSIVLFNRLQITRKQKLVIEEQKQEVEYQRDIAEKQKVEIIQQHHQLEEAHKEITDSITYAKRIQEAILPTDKVVKEYLTHSFVLYKPKDIVAGDFYWMETAQSNSLFEGGKGDFSSTNNDKIASTESLRSQYRNDVILFAAADCTGHGVPGAMVSVVCHNALNRAVREFNLTLPGEILDKTRELVVEQFKKSNEDVKDGMDIALCSLRQEDGTWKLDYAGANNPLWIIRSQHHSTLDLESPDNKIAGQASNDGCQLFEVKANKQPIGKFDDVFPYTTHTFNLVEGDTIYIFSDGFVDQFGGEKGKKFKSANFRKLLKSINSKSMEEQSVLINDAFEGWKGDLEQIDDVCVIGVRI